MIDPKIPLEELNRTSDGTLVQHLDIEYTDLGERHVSARMPVDERHYQPQKLLHGGASVTLAETVGSMASALMIDRDRYSVRGLNISANHVGSVKGGYVYARADLLHGGRTTHVWDIRVESEEGKTISLCRLTTMIIPR